MSFYSALLRLSLGTAPCWEETQISPQGGHLERLHGCALAHSLSEDPAPARHLPDMWGKMPQWILTPVHASSQLRPQTSWKTDKPSRPHCMNCKMGLTEPSKTTVKIKWDTAYEDPWKVWSVRRYYYHMWGLINLIYIFICRHMNFMTP